MIHKRITHEEAKKSFFPKPSYLMLNKNTHFTLTQDKNDPTIDHVHYWIERSTFDANLSFNEGYVYVLENHGIPGILKIGYTDRAVQDRIREINSGTGVVTPWYSISHFHCKSPKHIETLVHQSLSTYRVNKEGFNVSLKQAQEIISKIITENNATI